VAPRADTGKASRPWVTAAMALAVAGAMVGFYQVGALLGLRVGGFAWPFWPGNGLAFAVLVRRPVREWPLLAVAQVLGELLGGALVEAPFHAGSVAYALVDASESVLAAWLVWRVSPRRFDLRTLRRVGLFLGASLAAVAAAAVLATLVAIARGTGQPLRFLGLYAVGDLLGFAVVAPAVLRTLEGWPGGGPPARAREAEGTRARQAEGTALVLLLAAVSLGGFLVPWPTGSYALVHAVLPVLTWCALRFGTSGGSLGLLVVAAAGTALTVTGHGPFALLGGGRSGALAALQLFLSFVACTALLFAAAVAERRAAALALAHAAGAEAVGRLASGVAHDFRNYLAVMLSGASSAESELPPEHAAREDLDTVRRAGRSATQLTAHLLALARGTAGAVEVLDLGRVVADTERLARHLAGAEVRFTVAAPPLPLPVRVDRIELERVVFNLVGNARVAVRRGGSIAVEAVGAPVAPTGWAVLRVSDDGSGMDRETLERAFEPFFTTGGAEASSGLGLAAVRGIVERAAGRIAIESAPGAGTTVSISLPLAAPPPEGAATPLTGPG